MPNQDRLNSAMPFVVLNSFSNVFRMTAPVPFISLLSERLGDYHPDRPRRQFLILVLKIRYRTPGESPRSSGNAIILLHMSKCAGNGEF